MLDEEGMATEHVTRAINSRTLNLLAQFSATELVRMLYGSISGMMAPLLIMHSNAQFQGRFYGH